MSSPVDVAVCLLPGASRLAAQAVVELLEAANGLLAEPRYRISLGALQDIAMDRPWNRSGCSRPGARWPPAMRWPPCRRSCNAWPNARP